MSVHVDTCYIFAASASANVGNVEYKQQKLIQCDHDIPSCKTLCEREDNPFESCTWGDETGIRKFMECGTPKVRRHRILL
jgi:hypothetical protein